MFGRGKWGRCGAEQGWPWSHQNHASSGLGCMYCLNASEATPTANPTQKPLQLCFTAHLTTPHSGPIPCSLRAHACTFVGDVFVTDRRWGDTTASRAECNRELLKRKKNRADYARTAASRRMIAAISFCVCA